MENTTITKSETLYNQALEELKNNDDLFVDMVNELDSWNGYADGFRAYDMSELDELFYGCKLSEFLEKITSDFDLRDNYFIDTIYGLESCDDIAEHYRDNIDEEELLDNIIDNENNIYFYDKDFEELIDNIIDARDEEDEEDEEETEV